LVVWAIGALFVWLASENALLPSPRLRVDARVNQSVALEQPCSHQRFYITGDVCTSLVGGWDITLIDINDPERLYKLCGDGWCVCDGAFERNDVYALGDCPLRLNGPELNQEFFYCSKDSLETDIRPKCFVSDAAWTFPKEARTAFWAIGFGLWALWMLYAGSICTFRMVRWHKHKKLKKITPDPAIGLLTAQLRPVSELSVSHVSREVSESRVVLSTSELHQEAEYSTLRPGSLSSAKSDDEDVVQGKELTDVAF